MSGQLRLNTYRWITGIVALVMAFAIGAANVGAGNVAGNNGAPGSGLDKIAAQDKGGAELPGANNAPAVTCPSGQCFTDVPPGNTFYAFVNNIYAQGLVTGYPCGGLGEP